MKLIPVILSGGAGARLWPVSREGHPKPFMKLPDGETLIEKTYRRAIRLSKQINSDAGTPDIVTVTNRDYYFMSRDELDKAGQVNGHFLLEPFGRNTAGAIAMAAHYVKHKFGSNTLMLILSADHLIQDETALIQAVQQASKILTQQPNYLITFGIIPTGPETGFGYIKKGIELNEGFVVDSFVEKPDLATAQHYINSGEYVWNAGMFCFTAKALLNELQVCAPEVSNPVTVSWASMANIFDTNNKIIEIPGNLFQQVPDISIDYALMEPSKHVAVVPSDMQWSDIGSWNAIRDLVVADNNNNRFYGEAIFVNSKNTFIQSEDRLVAAVGVDNMMIIDTPDALLVANPNQSQEVKQVVSLLKKNNHESFKLHRTVMRPWGTYTVLEEGPGFKMKRIEVKPGARLSLQMHHHRSEHWVVVKGEALVVNGDEEIIIKQNQSTYIPKGHKHRLENKTQSELVLIEVQCGDYLGEDDIVRFEDNYGRVA